MVPGQRKREGGEGKKSNNRAAPKKLKALIVDDEEIQVQLLSDILLECGIEDIVSARNGEQAFALFRAEKPDIVISDIIMVKLSGLNLVRRIKSVNEKVPIILISGFLEYGKILEDSVIKPDDFMEKPLLPLKVRKLIQKYFPELKGRKKK